MIRFFNIMLLLILSLNARDNPFFPSDGESDIPLTSNQVNTAPPLKRATLTLPSTARTIENLTIEYKNLDGSIEKKTIVLKNSIDWHLPIFISQNYGSSSSEPIKSISKKKKYTELASLKFIKLLVGSKELKIITKDKMIREFLLVKPHRIVCDFKRDIEIRSYTKVLPKNSIVKKFRVGNHKGYYRVVLELDGYYSYRLKTTKDGYIFKLL